MAKRSHSQAVIDALKDPTDLDAVAQSIPDITPDEETALYSYHASTVLGGFVVLGDDAQPLLPGELITWMRARNLRNFDEVLDYGEPKAPATVAPAAAPLSLIERLFAPLIERHRQKKVHEAAANAWMDKMNSPAQIERLSAAWRERELLRAEEEAYYEPAPQPVYIIVEREPAPRQKPGFFASVAATAAGFWAVHTAHRMFGD